ncbi:sigma-70 family RNA polymerase sigma factor [Mycobacterium sp. SMC-17]|uniref:sigma-70 family RNA polymerase sigma factor n=1 Tax=Mycobacterium sp. SMC-17 TaxID=3381628 RepID=UPI00387617D4
MRDRQHDIACATAYLTNDLRRAPSIEELAEELEIDRDQVVESIVAAKAYQPQSLDVNVVDDDSRAQALGDSLGEMDAGFDRVTDRESVRSLLAALPRREQKVLYLRYFGAMTQRQIADSIGVSQMHVSRILDRTLRDLRAQVGCA